MSKKSLPAMQKQGKARLGDQIRSIADRLKQETDVQIKTTSRILGAAAQIAENHDRLINEVVDMVESDLNAEKQVSQKHTYNVDILKQEFKTLRDAKAYFNLKVSSWESLVNKLNAASTQTSRIQPKNQSNHGLTDKNMIVSEDNFNNIEKLTVVLEADVAEMFPNSEAVNEALRFLIRVTSKNSF
ncbi:hypothetical protein IQ229_10730 [Nostoc cf. edaphicum LEGE 07299]|uniref:Uncharacterized protein n=1 Tax=Nostoc cf. edaphicum LEGE 07299 TaxID=2777974 RepID=A0ABR9TY88_9NOSO|nr:hypothetical protein [Nostoc edaphicum]MBE9105398.1 hypothetical protein [Nostoc cf. edaphicum LEGE 07299]